MKALYTYLILFLSTFLPITTDAQKQPLDSSISVQQIKVDVKKDKLYLNFNIHVNQPELRSNQGIVLTPVLQSSGNSRTFPEVVINRRNRNISYNRTVERKSKAESYRNPYAVVKINKKSRMVIPYQAEIPFEAWMENSDLLLREDILCCRNLTQNISSQIVSQNIGIIPLLTYIYPKSISSEVPQDSISSVLFFPESMATILPGYRQNNQNILKAGSILNDKNLIVTNIHIVGAASPDGPYPFNENLSKKRAHSLSSFFASHYNVPSKLEDIVWLGEDWNSLLKMVEQSDLKTKQQIIDIIKRATPPAKRNETLMKLASGEPYRYMLIHFFPDLRYASYTIHYKAIPFNMAKGRELIFSAPHALSADEMLLIAAGYPTKSTEYKQVIYIAIKTHPENMDININASSIALSAGNTSEAKQYLLRFEQQPETWNNLGVVFLLEGNNKLAKEYFQKAIAHQDKNAISNMEKLIRQGKNSE